MNLIIKKNKYNELNKHNESNKKNEYHELNNFRTDHCTPKRPRRCGRGMQSTDRRQSHATVALPLP